MNDKVMTMLVMAVIVISSTISTAKLRILAQLGATHTTWDDISLGLNAIVGSVATIWLIGTWLSGTKK